MNSSVKIVENCPIPRASGRRKPSPNSLRGDLKRFTRERLITAAMDSFATDGFRATTVERLVDMAGRTAPTFYRHFASTNALLTPLQQRLTTEVRALFLLLAQAYEPRFAELRTLFDRYPTV